VSQRGVNPRWKPGSDDMRSMPPPSAMRKPVPSGGSGVGMGPSRDPNVLLQNNPDFEIPGMRPPGRGGGIAGGGRGGPMGGQALGGRIPMPVQNTNVPVSGLTGVSRYPQP
jgi:hypothetical protein